MRVCLPHLPRTTQQTPPLCRSFQLSPLLKQDRPQRRPSFQKTALNEESPLRVVSFLVMKFDQHFKIVFFSVFGASLVPAWGEGT